MKTPHSNLTPEQRRSERENAFVGFPTPLLGTRGPLVAPLTPRHHLWLVGYSNPGFVSGHWSVAATLQYLWICGPQFRAMVLRAAPFNGVAASWRALRFRLFCLRWGSKISTKGRVHDEVIAACIRHSWQIVFDRPETPRPLEEIRKAKESADVKEAVPHEIAVFQLNCVRTLGVGYAEFWDLPYIYLNGLLSLLVKKSDDAPDFDPDRDAQKSAYLNNRRRAHPPGDNPKN